MSRVTTPSKASQSIYLTVRRTHPDLVSVRLTKRALLALTRSLEREIAARARRPLLFGGFQRAVFFRDARPAWTSLAAGANAAVVFAEDFDGDDGDGADGIVRVNLQPEALLRMEWAVVCDDAAFGVVLSAWEIPGQEDVLDRERVFEVVWSMERAPVRAAARTCAQLAFEGGVADAERLLDELDTPVPEELDVRTVCNVLAAALAEVSDTGVR